MIANAPLHLPVAAPAAPGFRSGLARLGSRIWDALHAIGAARARAELLRMAQMREITDPQFAARLREVARDDWLKQG